MAIKDAITTARFPLVVITVRAFVKDCGIHVLPKSENNWLRINNMVLMVFCLEIYCFQFQLLFLDVFLSIQTDFHGFMDGYKVTSFHSKIV